MPSEARAFASSDLLPAPKGRAKDFARLLTTACMLGLVVHIAFLALFYQSGAVEMVYFNVGSVCCFMLATWQAKRQRTVAAMILIGAEMVLHAVAAVIVLGWGTGFHYYLILTSPVILASTFTAWRIKVVLNTFAVLTYVALDLGYRDALPMHILDRTTVTSLHTFNLVTVLLVLSGLTTLYVRLIQQTETRLRELATTDSLTGLMNRRCVMDALEREQARRVRKPGPMALMLVDIDHFKKLNDTWGHNMGDWALKAVSKVLKEGVRDMDFVARWGGEEFLIVLPLADVDAAWPVAERLRLMVSQVTYHLPKHPLRVTVTMGLTAFGLDEDVDAVIQRADAALYKGKSEGRDRVVIAAL